jgi:antirestriction protein ArdC
VCLLGSEPGNRLFTDEPRADHAQYLATWLFVLKADNKAIFTAASKASEAAAFLATFPAA